MHTNTQKSHFYHAIAGLRSAVLDWDSRIMIPYTNLFQNKKNKVIQASAEQFLKNELVLNQPVEEFGDRIPFDYLVIATGTHYPFPGKVSELDYETAHSRMQSLRSDVKSAKSVIIVGGGSVGIELAGEIREVYPDKKITIIHSKDSFLDDFDNSTAKSKKDVLALVQKNNIDTILNDAAVLPIDSKEPYYKPVDGLVKTKKGKSIQNVDLVMLAFGNRPQTEWLKNTDIGAEIVNSNGYIKVKDTFQVDHPDLSHVFVLGDAADFNESKLALRTNTHAPIVAKNLVQVAVEKSPIPTGLHKSTLTLMFISFGKKQGIGYIPLLGGIHVGSWLVSKLKGGSLFTFKSWETLNLTEPSSSER